LVEHTSSCSLLAFLVAPTSSCSLFAVWWGLLRRAACLPGDDFRFSAVMVQSIKHASKHICIVRTFARCRVTCQVCVTILLMSNQAVVRCRVTCQVCVNIHFDGKSSGVVSHARYVLIFILIANQAVVRCRDSCRACVNIQYDGQSSGRPLS
jgi:hypothetical protein